jgi:hypothetical protein
LVMRNGIELWIDEDKSEAVMKSLVENSKGMMMIDGRLLNAVDIMGIFTPKDLEDYHKTKRGMWKCRYGNWHERDGQCECARNIQPTFKSEEQTPEQRAKAREALDKVREELKNKF